MRTEGQEGSVRQVYMVLSPRSLAYAEGAMASLLRNSVDPVNLRLISDSEADRREVAETVAALRPEARHSWSVSGQEDLADAEASLFASLPHLRRFRRGHPCWRKVTDPMLLSGPGQEMIVVDPDVYFPNRFRFEETAQQGLNLMWQQPNCLLPPKVVRAAMDAGVRLARHVDIGVLHWCAGFDLEWLDWLIGLLGRAGLPQLMHVEAIVWAAIAMREGGGYLDPSLWVCWHRTQTKRVRQALGATGEEILAGEPWPQMKGFHAGGEAKWLMPALMGKNATEDRPELVAHGRTYPFVELTRSRYEWEQSAKGMLRSAGYYRVFGTREA